MTEEFIGSINNKNIKAHVFWKSSGEYSDNCYIIQQIKPFSHTYTLSLKIPPQKHPEENMEYAKSEIEIPTKLKGCHNNETIKLSIYTQFNMLYPLQKNEKEKFQWSHPVPHEKQREIHLHNIQRIEHLFETFFNTKIEFIKCNPYQAHLEKSNTDIIFESFIHFNERNEAINIHVNNHGNVKYKIWNRNQNSDIQKGIFYSGPQFKKEKNSNNLTKEETDFLFHPETSKNQIIHFLNNYYWENINDDLYYPFEHSTNQKLKEIKPVITSDINILTSIIKNCILAHPDIIKKVENFPIYGKIYSQTYEDKKMTVSIRDGYGNYIDDYNLKDIIDLVSEKENIIGRKKQNVSIRKRDFQQDNYYTFGFLIEKPNLHQLMDAKIKNKQIMEKIKQQESHKGYSLFSEDHKSYIYDENIENDFSIDIEEQNIKLKHVLYKQNQNQEIINVYQGNIKIDNNIIYLYYESNRDKPEIFINGFYDTKFEEHLREGEEMVFLGFKKQKIKMKPITFNKIDNGFGYHGVLKTLNEYIYVTFYSENSQRNESETITLHNKTGYLNLHMNSYDKDYLKNLYRDLNGNQ